MKIAAARIEPAQPYVLDVSRHVTVFDPNVFAGTRVDVIGCGSVGSEIGMGLAQLGVWDLHLWDFDRVEAHNIPNQRYLPRQIGRLKTEALAELILEKTGRPPTIHSQKVDGPVKLGNVVFLALDSMKARRDIFEQSLNLKIGTDLVVETRMGAEELRVYAFNPRDRTSVKKWLETFYEDTNTVENACRARTTVPATAAMTGALAVTRFVQWFRWEVARDPAASEPHFEQVMMLRPLITTVQ